MLAAVALLDVAGCAVLAALHLGVLAVALAAVTWMVAVTQGTVIDRIAGFATVGLAAVLMLGLIGPWLPVLFGPSLLAAAVAAPGALALAQGGWRHRSLRRFVDAESIVVLAMVGLAGWLYWRPFENRAPAHLVGAILTGGVDYLNHFDYTQIAWHHHGFAFVNSHHAILESRPHMTATPLGAHVAAAGMAVLLTGHSSLPSPVTTLRLFTDIYAAAGALLVLMFCATVTRLLRAAGVSQRTRCLAAAAVAATCLTGAFGPLYVDGFFTYVLGLSALLAGMAVLFGPAELRWRTQAALLGAAVTVAAFSYTLLAPVMLFLCLQFLLRTRAVWWRRPDRVPWVLAWSAAVVFVAVLSVVPTLKQLGALDHSGFITRPGWLPVVVVSVCVVIAVAANRAMTPAARELALLTAVTGALIGVLALQQYLRYGAINYYVEKLAYLWLVVGLVALLVQMAALGARRARVRMPVRLGGLVAGGVCLLWAAGLFPAIDQATKPGPTTPPRAIAYAFAERFMTHNLHNLTKTGTQSVSASSVRQPPLVVIWGPGIGWNANRWAATLRREWSGTADTLFLDVGRITHNAPRRLEVWMAAHPGQPVLLLGADEHWLRFAQDTARRIGGPVSVGALNCASRGCP